MKIFTVTLILVAIPPLHALITCSPLVLIPYTFPYLAESCNSTYDTFFAAVILTIIAATLSAFLVLRIFGYNSFREALNYNPLKDASFWVIWTWLSVFALGITLTSLLIAESL